MDEGQLDPNWYQTLLGRIPESETPGLLFARVIGETLEIDDARCLWVPDWGRCLTQQEIDDACRRVDEMLTQ